MHPQGFLLVNVGQWKVRCWCVLQSTTLTPSAMTISQLVPKWKCWWGGNPAHHYGTYKSHRGCLALQIHTSTEVLLSDHRTVKSTKLRCPPIHNIHPKCNGINQLVQKWKCLKYVLTCAHAHTHTHDYLNSPFFLPLHRKEHRNYVTEKNTTI